MSAHRWVARGLTGALRPILPWFGVDAQIFEAILDIKLLQDSRRPLSGVQRKTARAPRYTFLLALGLHLFMGMIIAFPLFTQKSPFLAMTLANTFIMIILGLTLTSDFTNVLLDTRDNPIILPRPVDDKALLAAKIAHIVVYLGSLLLSLSVVSLIVGTIKFHPLFPVVYLAILSLALILIIAVAYGFYFILLRFISLERFRDTVLYFQIAFSSLVYIGYQVLPRYSFETGAQDFDIGKHFWVALFPPAWMAAPVDLLMGHGGAIQVGLTGLAILVPCLSFLILVRILASGYGLALATLDSDASTHRSPVRPPVARRRWSQRISRLVARSSEAQASFEFLWQVASRDRQLKSSIYPLLPMILGPYIGLLFMSRGPEGGPFSSSSHFYLFILYTPCFYAPMILSLFKFSDRFEAAWIYEAMPLSRPGPVLCSAAKLTLVRFLLPVYLILLVILIPFFGPTVLLQGALSFSALAWLVVVFLRFFARAMPFSEQRTGRQTSMSQVAILLSSLGIIVFGILHRILMIVPVGVPLAIFLTAGAVLLGFNSLDRLQWKDMDSSIPLGIPSLPQRRAQRTRRGLQIVILVALFMILAVSVVLGTKRLWSGLDQVFLKSMLSITEGMSDKSFKLEKQAWGLRDQGKYDEALATCEEALKLSPKDVGIWEDKAEVLMDLKRYEESLQCYLKAIDLAAAQRNGPLACDESDRARLWEGKGDVLIALGRRDPAFGCYRQAEALCQESIKKGRDYCEYQQAGLLEKLGDFKGEAQVYDRMIKREKDGLATHGFDKAYALAQGGDREEALKVLDQVLQVSAKDIDLLGFKAALLERLSRLEEAQALYEEVLVVCQRQPIQIRSRADYVTREGFALIGLQRYEESLECFSRWKEKDGGGADVFEGQGNALSGLGRHEEAVAAFDQSLELDDTDTDVWEGKAEALIAVGRTEEARTALQAAADRFSVNARDRLREMGTMSPSPSPSPAKGGGDPDGKMPP